VVRGPSSRSRLIRRIPAQYPGPPNNSPGEPVWPNSAACRIRDRSRSDSRLLSAGHEPGNSADDRHHRHLRRKSIPHKTIVTFSITFNGSLRCLCRELQRLRHVCGQRFLGTHLHRPGSPACSVLALKEVGNGVEHA
jgi:hypothetical protein